MKFLITYLKPFLWHFFRLVFSYSVQHFCSYSPENKLLIYEAILKPIGTYCVQMWGSALNSIIEILERFQSKMLQIITDVPWYESYVTYTCRRLDKKCVTTVSPTGKDLTITRNKLAKSLFQKPNYSRRLKRYYPVDLANRFNWYCLTFPETISNNLWLSLTF